VAIDYERARRVLARRDPVLRDLMRTIGPCGLGGSGHRDPFRALARAIVGQQLSVKAAATISARFEALCGGRPTATRVAALSDARLRGVGLSGQKLGYLRDLSRRVSDKSLVLAALDAMSDDEVIAALTEVKGIGRWTAEMFLMFRLERPDVLPVGDLGIVRAIERAYRLRKTPTPERMLAIGERWRPYRTVACWYLWASLDNAPGKD
jgi:DNA-3-methyladenine glycosylase II